MELLPYKHILVITDFGTCPIQWINVNVMKWEMLLGNIAALIIPLGPSVLIKPNLDLTKPNLTKSNMFSTRFVHWGSTSSFQARDITNILR